MHYRVATLADVPLLARMNEHLRADEQSRWHLTMPELESRMQRFLESGYTAVLFEQADQPVGYALYQSVEDGIYLRQFFVRHDVRRQGIGKHAMRLLLDHIWPPQARITLDVLVHNQRAYAFWKAVGFSDYAITMELVRETS